MNWKELFFGWLIKGQYEVSMLDSIMFILELSVVLSIFVGILSLIPEKKDKRNK
jgi:hypothetical protein